MDYNIALIFGLSAISLIFAYLAAHLDKSDNGGLQVFFIGLSYLFVFGIIASIEVITEIQGVTKILPLINSLLSVVIFSGFFFIVYLAQKIIRNTVSWVKYRKEQKKEDKYNGRK